MLLHLFNPVSFNSHFLKTEKTHLLREKPLKNNDETRRQAEHENNQIQKDKQQKPLWEETMKFLWAWRALNTSNEKNALLLLLGDWSGTSQKSLWIQTLFSVWNPNL